MNALDGNVLAGPGSDLVGFDLTMLSGECETCGDSAVLAQSLVYGAPMGYVARCRICSAVLLILTTGGSPTINMAGLRRARFSTTSA